MSPPSKTVAPPQCKRCTGLADYPSDLCVSCKHDRAERHREEARRQALEASHPSVGLALVPPSDADLAALVAELGDEIAAVEPPTCSGDGDDGVGLAGTLLPGDEGDLRPAGVNVPTPTAVPVVEESMVSQLPPPWDQDGPPYRCEHPGCRKHSMTLRGINVHRALVHQLTAEPGERKATRMPTIATIDTSELLARLTLQWSTIGILEVRFLPLDDGRLAFQARLLDGPEQTGGHAA